MSSPPASEPKIYRDEEKTAKNREKQRKEIIMYTERVLSRILSKPTLWKDPDMSKIRSYIEQIRNDSSNYPDKSKLISDLSTSTTVVQKITSTTTPELSEKFIEGVYDCSTETHIGLNYVPIVQIINHELRNRSFFCYVRKEIVSVKSITLTALDKSGYHIPIKLSTQEHAKYFSGSIQKGTILAIEKFTSLYFEYTLNEKNTSKPTNVIVLGLAIKVLGHFDPVFADNFVCKKQLSVNFLPVKTIEMEDDSSTSSLIKRKFETDSPLYLTQMPDDDDNDNDNQSGK